MDNWQDAMLRYLDGQADEEAVERNVLAAAHLLWVATMRKERGAKLSELRLRVKDGGEVELSASFGVEPS